MKQFRFILRVKMNGRWMIHTATNKEKRAWSALDKCEDLCPCELYENGSMIWVVL